MSKRRLSDTAILAVALFATTGAVLAYNIYSSDGGSVSVSLSDMIRTEESANMLITECAAELLENGTVHTSTAPEDAPTLPTLLPPIVTPPTE